MKKIIIVLMPLFLNMACGPKECPEEFLKETMEFSLLLKSEDKTAIAEKCVEFLPKAKANDSCKIPGSGSGSSYQGIIFSKVKEQCDKYSK